MKSYGGWGNVKRKLLSFLVQVVLMQLFVPVVHSFSSGEVDATAIASWVVDGDTFDVTSGDRIRLADVDAPESGESGYYDAKNFLISLVYDKQVYLDIDDIYMTDQYGRLVCVVYVEHNFTHFKNVNKALLVGGFAVIRDFDNEFNPYTWSLHYLKEEIPEFPSPTIIPLLMIATLLAVIVYRRKHFA